MAEPRADQRRELFNRMQTIVKETGPFTGFRRSDLMKHDREFILKQWTGEPLLWFPYDSGTHMIRLGGRTTGRQRDEVLAVLDTAAVDFADVHFFIIEGPQFPPREVPGRQIRDEVMDLLEGEKRSEPYEDNPRMSDRTFRFEGGSFLMHKYGLTRDEAEDLMSRPDVRVREIMVQVDRWSNEHGAASASPLTRGYLLELLGQREGLERETFRDNAISKRYGVPYLLSFDGRGGVRMGRGEAGHTVRHFASAQEALEFARSIPGASQVRAHDRLIGQLEAETGAYESNADYYVWPLRHNVPLAGYGPYGPFDMMTAKTYARARSQEGTHDSAVTRGQDPQRFDIVRIYQAGTGERVYPPGSEGFEANSVQPFRGNQMVILEKRTPGGSLDFSPPQPPSGPMSFDAVYDLWFREHPSAERASWEELNEWLDARGWRVRAKTW